MNTTRLTVALAFLAIAVSASAEMVSIDMSFYSQIDQITTSGTPGLYRTSIYRGYISGSVNSVTLYDSGAGGADPGVFSGMDVDFVLLDKDGDLSTTDDQVMPSLDPTRTYVNPGSVVTPAGVFTPRPNRPGKLFGLNAANKLDNAITTIRARDAWYPIAADNNGVTKSKGWVSLGVNGSMHVEFDGLDTFSGELAANSPDEYLSDDSVDLPDRNEVAAQEDWYLFVGEVGMRNEEPVFDPQAELGEVIVDLTGLEVLEDTLFSPEDGVLLDGDMPGSTGIEYYEWKIGEAGAFEADPLGQSGGTGGPPADLRQLQLNYWDLADMYPDKVNDIMIGSYDPDSPLLDTLPIFLRVHTVDGNFTDFQAADITLVNMVIPEPTSLGLIAMGGLAILRRRRR